jgi:O-antigen/teichoic acid export membrane protein
LNLLNRIVYVTWLEGILNLVFSILLGIKFGLIGIAAGTFLGTFLSPFFLFSYILRKRTENLIFQDDNYIVKHFLISLLPTIFLGYLINVSQSIIIITITQTALLCILYLILSYICLPPEYKIFVQNTFRKKKLLIYDIFKSNESS